MSSASTKHVLILGAGFGGLELSTRLSGVDGVRVTLIDRSDGFTFGFSKFDILFGTKTAEQVKLPYSAISKPGVEFRQEEVTSIDPRNRVVQTDANTYEPDVLVVALGADYVPYDGHEFYSVEGAERLRDVLPSIERGVVQVGILGVPFKCPPAPWESMFLMHDYFVERGVRDDVELRIASPMPSPIPVSPTASQAIIGRLDECGISYEFGHRPNPGSGEDYFIAIPLHKTPDVVQASGLTEGGTDGWVKVDPKNLRTPFDGVYALGDLADAPVPRAGTLAESAARAVAEDIVGSLEVPYEGRGICFVEFGRGEIGMVNVDFLSGPTPQAPLVGPSKDLMAEKEKFGVDRRRRWFGL